MKERLNKEERELLTGLAIQYGVGIIPEALDAIEQSRQAANNGRTTGERSAQD